MSSRVLMVGSRFCGPPESGNGGYSAGLVANVLGGSVEVTLRRPPPLERPLQVEVLGDTATLKDGELLVAEGRRAALADLPPPEAPSFERACELSTHYVGHGKHHFPGCFVCGPARAAGDGLRIFPGSDHPDERVAAPWVPDGSLGGDGESRTVRPEFLWAALDCIGYFASGAPDYPVALLGRMTAELSGSIRVGERCVVLGWSIAREGRKLHAGTAVYGEDAALRGHARQTWIVI